MLEALVAQPHRDAERTGSVVAEDDDGLIRIKLLMGARGDFAHGHEERARQAGSVELPGFTDVEKERWIGVAALFCECLGGDLGIEHKVQDKQMVAVASLQEVK